MNIEILGNTSDSTTRSGTIAAAYAEYCRFRSRLQACDHKAGAAALRWTDYLLSESVLAKKNPAYLSSLQRPSHRLRTWARAVLRRFQFFMENRSIRKARFDIAFVPINDSHLKAQFPVAKALRERGKQVLFISSRKHYRPIIEGNDFPFFWIDDAMLVTGTAFQDVLRWIDDDEIRFLIKKRRAKIENWEKCFELAIQLFRLRAVIVGNDILAECRVASAISKNHGLPVFCLQHGSMNRCNPIYVESVADRYYVYGDITHQELIELGMDPHKLVVAGAPYLEEATGTRTRESVLQELEPKSERIGLVLLSGPGHSTKKAHWRQIMETLISASRQFEDVQFVLKLHPKENVNAYREISQEIIVLDNTSLTCRNLTLCDLLRTCAFVVTGASTSAIEAMIFGKPVFTVDFMQEYSEAELIQAGATIHSSTPQQFVNNIQTFLSGEAHFESTFASARKFLERFFYQPEQSKPSQFIAADVSRLMDNCHP